MVPQGAIGKTPIAIPLTLDVKHAVIIDTSHPICIQFRRQTIDVCGRNIVRNDHRRRRHEPRLHDTEQSRHNVWFLPTQRSKSTVRLGHDARCIKTDPRATEKWASFVGAMFVLQ
jgi:hypothetical protein